MGPLTNIALAIRMDESFLLKLKKIIIMGGTVEGIGNTAPGVEFNFHVDPEANHIVLNGSEHKEGSMFLLPWEPSYHMDIKHVTTSHQHRSK
jgi:purine nucleosidase